jgi:hypothetical protein
MKQQSLGPLVISKTARLTTITCRSRAPRLTSVSHPALCQKIPCPYAIALARCHSSQNAPHKFHCVIFPPPPPPKKNTVLLRANIDLHYERRGRRRSVIKVLHPLRALDSRRCPHEEDKVVHIEVALDRGVLQQQLASLVIGSSLTRWCTLRHLLSLLPAQRKPSGAKDENGRKRSKTDLRYRKTKTVGSGYFYIWQLKSTKNGWK